MKVDPDTSPVSDFAVLLDAANFRSSLPSASTLQDAYADPAARYALGDDQLGRQLMETSMRAFRFVGARVGTSTGIPSNVVDAFFKTLSIKGQDQAVVEWVMIAVGQVTEVIVDVAINAMGAIPIVGWIAKAVASIVKLVVSMASDKKPPPPLVQYNEGKDETLVREVLSILAGVDWTKIFLPTYEASKWSDWELKKMQGGYLMRPKESSGHPFGAIPGGPFGSRGVQSRNCVDPDNWHWPTPPIWKQEWDADIDRAVDISDQVWAKYYEQGTECILDIWSTTPAVGRVTMAAWQQMTSRKTTALWNVDARPIASAWESYVSSALEFATVKLRSRFNEYEKFEWLAYQNLRAAMHARNAELPGGDTGKWPRLDAMAGAYAKDLRRRQFAAVKTILVAYADPKQAAFAQHSALRMAMEAERRQILSGPIRWSVHMPDVVDREWKRALEESMRGVPPPQRTPPDDRGSLELIPTAEGFPTLDNQAGGGGLLALGLMLAAGLFLL